MFLLTFLDFLLRVEDRLYQRQRAREEAAREALRRELEAAERRRNANDS